MFRLSAEESIRKRCLDREEYYREIRTYKKIIREQEVCIAEKDSTIQELLAGMFMVKQLMVMIGFFDIGLMIECAVGVSLVFMLIYAYKKIIREQEVCIAEKDSTIQELLARIEELETEGRKTP